MQKPTCKKCGLEHWGFVKCADAPAVLERETEVAVERAKNAVIPQPQHDPPARNGMKNYRQVGVNRFVRVTHPNQEG